jgi:hypothetical protein
MHLDLLDGRPQEKPLLARDGPTDLVDAGLYGVDGLSPFLEEPFPVNRFPAVNGHGGLDFQGPVSLGQGFIDAL